MQRIMIIGGSGSGKSTLAREIGTRTGLPVVHIDPMYWAAGWVQRPASVTQIMALAAITADAWVFEGNNTPTMDDRAERAELIVFLDLPRWVRMRRLLRRTWTYLGQSRPDMSPGCPERFDWGFLRFAWNYDREGRIRALAFLDHWRDRRRVVHLRSVAQVSVFVTGSGWVETHLTFGS